MLALHDVRLRSTFRACAFAALLVAGAARSAEPSVPYVPTPQDVVDRMLEIAKVGPHDYLIDLGSGDGRIVITAAKRFGTRGFGVDLNPERVREANENARKAGVADKVAFYRRDLFETDLGEATVITMYLLPQVNLMLRPRLLELKPGTRIVSHDFNMQDWPPDQHVEMNAPDKYGGSGGMSDVYLWIVPAKVEGKWSFRLPLRGGAVGYEMEARQRYQSVAGTVRVGGRTVPLENARIDGERIEAYFTAEIGGSPVRHVLSGIVGAGGITGTAELSGPRMESRLEWQAVRP